MQVQSDKLASLLSCGHRWEWIEGNASRPSDLYATILRSTNRRWRHDGLDQASRHVIDEAGNEPLARQCENRPQRSNINSNRRAGIGDCFRLEFAFLNLKIMRQHGGVTRKPSDTAIGVLKYDDVKLPP